MPTVEIVLPVYIMGGKKGMITSGEVILEKSKTGYRGFLEFDTLFNPKETEENQLTFPFALVYGARGERVSIGDITFDRNGDLFGGEIFIGIEHEGLMFGARSLISM
jgi:hypothetical protein